MATPVLYLLAGPNGAGKTTFFERILGPATGLPFVNADHIALSRWPADPTGHAYEAAREAAEVRKRLIEERRSFATETVFSHPSKLDLVRTAGMAGYYRTLYGILIPEELAVQRVLVRVRTGGHDVPEEKIRRRFQRLWRLVREAVQQVEDVEILDNSQARNPFRLVARFHHGELLGPARWPLWAPSELVEDLR